MKKKWLSATASVVIACSMTLGAAGCTGIPAEGDPEVTQPPVSEAPAAEEDPAEVNAYNTAIAAVPVSWNPHTWVSVDDMVPLEYVVTPLVANYKGEDGETVYDYHAATSVTDITADFADKEKWGIDADATENFVYQIDLNPLLTWNDGTAINADDYIYSMQALLEPAMKNFRAGRYSVGAEAIRGAFKYNNKDKAGKDIFVNAFGMETDENTVFYLNPDVTCYFFGSNSMKDYYNASFAPFFMSDDGVDLYKKYAEIGDFFEVTEEIKAELLEIASGFGDNNPEAWVEFCFVPEGVYEDAVWEDVGLYKTDDYQLVLITEQPMNMTAMLTLLKRSWLVNETVYEAGKAASGGVTTDYNTIFGQSMSFGPYAVVDADETQIVLEKNENWYGWNGEIHQGLFTYEEFGDFDSVVIAIPVPEQETATEDEKPEVSSEAGETHAFPFEFSTEDLYGNTVTAESIGEKEIFFLHLWATWCGPCVQEMGDLAKLANDYGDRVGFIGLVSDFDTNTKGAVKLTEYHNIPFINVYSQAPDLAPVLQMLKSGYVPTTVLVDGEGNMIGEQIIGSMGEGYIDLIEAALKAVNE